MEDECDVAPYSKPTVKVTLRLGSEAFSANSNVGALSQQLASVKQECMAILKDFIAKHNAPNDVPDEPLEGSSEGEDETLVNPVKKIKK